LGDPLMSSPTIKDGKVYTAYPAGNGPVLNLKAGDAVQPQHKHAKPKKALEQIEVEDKPQL